MEIIIKNLQEKHLALIAGLAKTLNFEISKPIENGNYDPEFIEKIKQGEEGIKFGRTTKMTLDDIWK